MTCCGVTVVMLQGRVGLLIRRANHSEHGNHPGPADPGAASPRVSAGRTDRRSGQGGRSRRTPSRGEPGTWGRAAAVSRREGDCNAERRGGEYRRSSTRTRWVHALGYRGCRPSFTIGRRSDPGRSFDDLFNLVYDPATLLVAFDRVAANPVPRLLGWTV